MWTPQKTKDGLATNYGMGLGVGKLDNKPTASHSGSQEKTATMMLMVPGDRLTVAIMSNTEGASLGRLADELAAEWLGVTLAAPKPKAVKPAEKPADKPVVPAVAK
jgi:CubicO group peptidase (beta-lactamase class C family)